jgi:hypothetical protein
MGLQDAALHCEHGLPDVTFGAKPVERSELECLMRWNANRDHVFKIEYETKQYL